MLAWQGQSKKFANQPAQLGSSYTGFNAAAKESSLSVIVAVEKTEEYVALQSYFRQKR